MVDGDGFDDDWDDAPRPGAGWSARDIDMLEELAGLGMQMVRALNRTVAQRNDAAEAGAEPMSAEELSCVALAFTRLSRDIRFTLAMKAEACGGERSGTCVTRPMRIVQAREPVSAAGMEAAMAASELRLERDPAERRERFERREIETEGETFRLTSLPEALGQIAQRLGVDLEEVRARVAARSGAPETLPHRGRDSPAKPGRVGRPDTAHQDSS